MNRDHIEELMACMRAMTEAQQKIAAALEKISKDVSDIADSASHIGGAN